MRPGIWKDGLWLLAFVPIAVLSTVTACSIIAPKSYPTILSGKSIDLSTLQVAEPYGKGQVAFRLNEEGTKIFTDYTDKHIGQYVCITLDKKVLTCPKILQPMRGGAAVIEGQYTKEQAQQMADEIKDNQQKLEFVAAGDAPLTVGETVQTTGVPLN